MSPLPSSWKLATFWSSRTTLSPFKWIFDLSPVWPKPEKCRAWTIQVRRFSRKADIIFQVQVSKLFSFAFPSRVTYYINIWYPLMEMNQRSASVYALYEDDGRNLEAVQQESLAYGAASESISKNLHICHWLKVLNNFKSVSCKICLKKMALIAGNILQVFLFLSWKDLHCGEWSIRFHLDIGMWCFL